MKVKPQTALMVLMLYALAAIGITVWWVATNQGEIGGNTLLLMQSAMPLAAVGFILWLVLASKGPEAKSVGEWWKMALDPSYKPVPDFANPAPESVVAEPQVPRQESCGVLFARLFAFAFLGGMLMWFTRSTPHQGAEFGPAGAPPSHPAAAPAAAPAAVPLAAQLSAINGSGDSGVNSFTRLLADLDAKVPEGQQQIADMSVRSWQMLNAKGVKVSLLGLMADLDASIPAGNSVSYAELAAAYVTLRAK